jgi:RNA polymerase sigma-70 factor (ECF subfamily)
MAEASLAAAANLPVDRSQQAATEQMDRFRRTGDSSLLADLYERHRGSLLGQIQRALAGAGRRVDAEDVLHDAWLNIARYRHAFRADRPEAFRIWAGRIARNCAFRRMRGASDRRLQFVDPTEAPDAVDVRAPAPARVAEDRESAGPVDFAFALLLAAWVRAYAQAPAADRDLLAAVELDGVAYADLARRLRIRQTTLKVRVFRARQRLLRGVAEALAGAAATSAAAA